MPKEIHDLFLPRIIIIIQKPLYSILEAGTHWWATYYKHHYDKLSIVTSLYNLCLLVTITKDIFGVIGMQTDNTLILGNKAFTQLKEKELTKAKLSVKPAKALLYNTPLMFNRCILKEDKDNIMLVQKGQGMRL